MAVNESTRNLCADNTLTRRAALAGTAACGALALPAGAALAVESATVADSGTDHPLVALWEELLDLVDAFNAYDGPGEAEDSPIGARLDEVEHLIETAQPDDPVGLAVQARYLERWLCIGTNGEEIGWAGRIAAGLARLGGVEVRADEKMVAHAYGGWEALS